MKTGTLCYVKRGNKVLMMNRNIKKGDIHKGKYNGLGGKLAPGETPEECVIREVKEESGLDIVNPVLHGILTFPAFDGIEDWMVFLFSAVSEEGELSDCNEGSLVWVDEDRLFDLPLWEGDPIFINWMKEPRFFSAKFIYNQGRLLSHSVVFYPYK